MPLSFQLIQLCIVCDSFVLLSGFQLDIYTGQLGIGNTTNQTSPVTIAGLTGVSQLVTGSNCAYALMNDGTVKAWGNNYYGQLGTGNTTNQSSPVTLSNLAGVDHLISGGGGSAYAMMNDGTVKAWGRNDSGQLGIGSTTDQSSPVTIQGLTGVDQMVATTDYENDYAYSTYALMSNGTVKAWGYNGYGELGIGSTTNQSSPVTVPSLTGVDKIIAGTIGVYALMNDGTAKAWGANYSGQLGLGNTTTQTSPVTIPNLTGINQLIAGGNCAYAIMNNSTVRAWGANYYGQLGIGNTANQTSPVTISGLTGVNQIIANGNSAYALMNDSTVKAWGYNEYGQLGIGNTTNQTSPIVISGLTGVEQIITGAYYTYNCTYALMNNGTVKAWGCNNYGQLGTGNMTNQTSPVILSGLAGVEQLIAGRNCAYALMDDSTTKSWGYNNVGQLGLGYSNKIISPVTLLYFEAIAQSSWGTSNDVTIVKTDMVPYAVRKWAIGSHSASYFASNGTEFTGDSFTVSQNGLYTVYEQDSNGDILIGTVTVDHVFTPVTIGNFVESFNDISVNSTGINMNIGRTYDSSNTTTGVLGTGWTLNYSASIKDVTYTYSDDNNASQSATIGSLKKVTMPDSTEYIFHLSNGVYTAYNTRSTMVQNSNGTFTLTTKEDTNYNFNTSGYLTSIVDKHGNTVMIVVDSNGNVQSITDTVGRTYSIGYTNGKITSGTDPMSRTVTYGYTGNNLTSVTNPMGQTTTYTYTNGVLTQINDPLSNISKAIAYTGGKVSSITNSSGDTTTYAFDADLNTVAITDSKNNVTVSEYDDFNLLVSTGTTAETAAATTYNQYGEEVTTADATYTYNSAGDVTLVTYLNGTPDVTSDDTTEAYAYNTNGTLNTYTDRNGIKTFYQYDTNENPTLIAKQKDGTTIDYSSTCDQSLFEITQYTYNSNGTVATQTDNDGKVTTYAYNSYGYQTSATAVKDSQTVSTETDTYNTVGWNLTNSATIDGKTTSAANDYDLNGTLLRTRNQKNEYTRYVYDAAGRLVQKVGFEQYRTNSDQLAAGTGYNYTNTTVGERYVYDSYNNILRYTNAQGKVTRYVFNSNHKLAQKILPDQYNSADDELYYTTPVDGYEDASTGYRYSYNTNGDVNREIAPNGNTTRYIYDSNKNLIQRILPDQYIAANDGLNQSTPVDIYSDSNVGYRYTYNTKHVLLREIDPNGSTTRYVYNSNGKLVQQINSSQYVAANDGLNQSTPADTYSDNTSGYRYTYYDNGTKETVTTPDGAVFSYNSDGNIVTEAYANGRTNTTAYNADGTVNTVTNGNNYSLTYSYDTSKNVTGYNEVFGSNQNNITYTYDAGGNILTISNAGVLQVTYTYDSYGQLVREDSVVQNKSIAYTYNASGNITSKKEYAYTLGTLSNPTNTYNYSYTNSSDADQLTSYNGNAITYDGDGNALTYNGWTYTWNNGNLASATNTGNSVTYAYRADGIRTGKTVNGTTTTYTLDGNTIASETTGTTTVHYFYDSNGTPVYMTLNGTAYYYKHNMQGDITGIVDSSNNEVVTYTYNSWGKLLNIGGTLASTVGLTNHLRYRGYYYDTETGLYYLQSRYYNPEIGRFISKDEPSYQEGETGAKANLYAYCINNPVMNSDPTGYFVINRWILALGLNIVLTLVAPYFSGPMDIFGRALKAIANKRNISLIWDRLLYDIVPKFTLYFTKFFTFIRTAIWRVTGSVISNSTTTLIGTNVSNFLNLYKKANWNELVDVVSCFFSAGSMIAGFLDYADGRFDGKVRF